MERMIARSLNCNVETNILAGERAGFRQYRSTNQMWLCSFSKLKMLFTKETF
jgi:hypothetical protein